VWWGGVVVVGGVVERGGVGGVVGVMVGREVGYGGG